MTLQLYSELSNEVLLCSLHGLLKVRGRGKQIPKPAKRPGNKAWESRAEWVTELGGPLLSTLTLRDWG